jgi:hypothetical protein
MAADDAMRTQLRNVAPNLGLQLDTLLQIVFDPHLKSLSDNRARRYRIYKAIAAAMGVVRFVFSSRRLLLFLCPS